MMVGESLMQRNRPKDTISLLNDYLSNIKFSLSNT